MKFLNAAILAPVALGIALITVPAFSAEVSAGSEGSGEASRAGRGGARIAERGSPIAPIDLDEQGVPRALELDRDKIERGFDTIIRHRDGTETEREASEGLKRMLGGGRTMRRGTDPSFAEGGTARQVFGADDRVQITDSSGYPFRTFGLLQGQDGDGGLFNCSATLIGPRTLLTAAHCLYNHETGWLDDFVFAPGLLSMQDAPHGVYDYETAYIFRGYIENYEGYYGSVVPWDIAVVILQYPVGNDLGWMGYGYDDNLGRFVANIIGYPGDMPSGTMWAVSCDVAPEAMQDMYFQYLCDTYPGSSGSSVYKYNAATDERVIYGVNVAESPSANTAVRINRMYFEWLGGLVE
ncbi:MAG: serine protease [Rhizobiaceae bacterium]|nr:serine protease [Rhizobiaceae bacterium]